MTKENKKYASVLLYSSFQLAKESGKDGLRELAKVIPFQSKDDIGKIEGQLIDIETAKKLSETMRKEFPKSPTAGLIAANMDQYVWVMEK